jgi:hypothetical protein
MGGFEFHVVAEHWGELLRADLAVVRPGRQIVVAAGFGMLLWFLALKLTLTGALFGVLRELEIIELIERTLVLLTLVWRRTGRFRIPKKVALQGLVRLGHGWRSDPWIVSLTAVEDVFGSPQAVKLDSKVGQGSGCM